MDRRIQLIIGLLESNLSSPPDFDGIARQVNLSPSRLRHLFKEETGQSPRLYLKELRLRRAAVLLRTTFLSIKEIAAEVGVSNPTYLSRAFTKHFGVPPTVYRNRG